MNMKNLSMAISAAVAAAAMVSCSGTAGEDGFSSTVFSAGQDGVTIYRIPAVIQTLDGTVIAFAEARNDGLDDTGDIDLVCRRSTDGGRTWGETVMIWNAGPNLCNNPCPVVDRSSGRIILLCNWGLSVDTEWMVMQKNSTDTRRAFVLYSDDDGLTWSEPREITESAKDPTWTSYAFGPCHAIQLQKGEHAGRIVAPANHGVFGVGTESNVVLSDDNGQTWRVGGLPGDGNECTVAELANGDLMLNMREFNDRDSRTRIVAVSHDGGETFEEPWHDDALVEPVCNASLVNYNPSGDLTETLLFCNPADRQDRINLTVKRSDDSGRTWRPVCPVSEIGAYCDLLVLPDGSLGVLYETGAQKNDYDAIVFTVISASKLQ